MNNQSKNVASSRMNPFLDRIGKAKSTASKIKAINTDEFRERNPILDPQYHRGSETDRNNFELKKSPIQAKKLKKPVAHKSPVICTKHKTIDVLSALSARKNQKRSVSKPPDAFSNSPQGHMRFSYDSSQFKKKGAKIKARIKRKSSIKFTDIGLINTDKKKVSRIVDSFNKQPELQDMMSQPSLRAKRMKHAKKNKRIFDSNGNNVNTQNLKVPTFNQNKFMNRKTHRNQKSVDDKTITFDLRNKETGLNMMRNTVEKGFTTPTVSHARNNNLSLSQMTNSKKMFASDKKIERDHKISGGRSNSLSQNLLKKIQLTPMIEVIPKERS